jgi:hypothetical protein
VGLQKVVSASISFRRIELTERVHFAAKPIKEGIPTGPAGNAGIMLGMHRVCRSPSAEASFGGRKRKGHQQTPLGSLLMPFSVLGLSPGELRLAWRSTSLETTDESGRGMTQNDFRASPLGGSKKLAGLHRPNLTAIPAPSLNAALVFT